MPSKPEFTVQAGIFRLKWTSESVEMLFTRLAEERNTVTAEMLVRSWAPGYTSGGKPAHILQSRINLLLTPNRQQVLKVLQERIEGLDWYALLEQATVMVVTKYREGEPPIFVGNLPSKEDEGYLVWPLVRMGEPTVLYGPGGSGKSMLTAYIAILAQTAHARPVHGLNTHPVAKNVLYNDYESSQEELNERIKALRRGMGIDKVEILYRYAVRPLHEDIAELQAVMMEHDIGFLINDSLGLAMGGEPENADNALKLFGALRALRRPSLNIHHTPKEGSSPFGSVYITNMARNLFSIQKTQEEGADRLTVGLYHRKINRGKLVEPFGIEFNFSQNAELEEMITVWGKNLLEIPEQAVGMPLHMRIEDMLKHARGPLKAKEISEELNVPVGQVEAKLEQGKGTRFQSISGELWGLSAFVNEDDTP